MAQQRGEMQLKGSRNAKSVEKSLRSSNFTNCISENKGCKYSTSKGGPSKGYKLTKGDSQQRQHSYRKGVLEIAYLCCSDSLG